MGKVACSPGTARNAKLETINAVLQHGGLHAVFQPILDFRLRGMVAFEGLIRGPLNSPLHSPAALFAAAAAAGCEPELEDACRRTVVTAFARSGLPGKLFLNCSPQSVLEFADSRERLRDFCEALGLSPGRIVIELTENQEVVNLPGIRHVLNEARSLGCQFAIDDLGAGFSNLRLWSEIRPEYVKIDRHFIDGIADDTFKYHFVRAMQDMADVCSARLIAEGIEREEDFLAVRDLGIGCAQGYFIARPSSMASALVASPVRYLMDRGRAAVFPMGGLPVQAATARKLMQYVAPVASGVCNDEVIARFEADPKLYVLPVVDDGLPVGLISRSSLLDDFSRPFRREVYGRRSCALFMDSSPLVVDQKVPVQELGLILSRSDRRHLQDGFIIVADGCYAGIGNSQDLVALITEMQISAARYANPLTQLPGNVPINEHVDRLLGRLLSFVVVHVDVDHFKPFNDAYGYRLGDDVIQGVAAMLVDVIDAGRDFVGHIGGDDFMIVFQSDDWEERCHTLLQRFDESMPIYFPADDIARGHYLGESRTGEPVRHDLLSISCGALPVAPGAYESHREVATAAAIAKKQAKKMPGSSLFVERRGRLRIALPGRTAEVVLPEVL